MEHSLDTAQMLEQLMCPAFIVQDGIIIHANQAALQRQIKRNTNISDLICIGKDEYETYADGKLCLTLSIQGITYNATVTKAENSHLFCLETDYEDPELRAFALAAQQLREPLAKAMVSTELLLPNASVRKDAEATQYLSQVNRSLHQLLRAVCNMSDAAQYTDPNRANLQTQNATKIFNDILEKAADLAAQAKRTLTYTVPKQAVFCPIDEEKLERAILNLLSNAIKFTPKGGTINATLHQSGSRLLFTVQDSGEGADLQSRADMFSRFLREPGIEDGRNGIGLGMSIVRSVAAAHSGTVLIQQPESAGVKITMTLSLKQPADNMFRSLIKLPIDYAGGYDHCLLELSDVLPDDMFLDNM